MKNFKRIFAIMLTAVMVLTLGIATCITASAADSPQITITPPQDGVAHQYSAYQIFAGDLVNGKLSNVEWGTGIKATGTDNSASFLAALKDDDLLVDGTDNIFKTASTAAEVADILSQYDDNSAIAVEFASVANSYLTTTCTSANSAANAASCAVTVPQNGYYLVKDTSSNASALKTRFMLQVLGTANVVAKPVLPTLDKKIIEDSTQVTENVAGVGDSIQFQLTSAVPDMTGYSKYFFIINDTLSQGLTYDSTVTPVVEVDSTTLTAGEDYVLTTTPDTDTGETAIKIVFKDFVNKQGENADKPIVVTYSAKLNENANLTMDGNINTASLTYSNDPTSTGDPDNDGDEPTPYDPTNPDNPYDPTGETPEVTTKTFTTSIQLTKVKKGTTTALTGAEFTITGMGSKTTLVTGTEYVADNTGTYYMLKDGSFTTTAPTTSTEAQYNNTNPYQKYKLTALVKEQKTEGTNAPIKAFVNSDGTLTFAGLDEGTYTITETLAPTGYNKLLNPINVTISATKDTAGKYVGFSSTNTDVTYDDDNNMLTFNVENSEGATLPATGGMGTKLFYILGSIMVLGSVLVLVTRKRIASSAK